MNTAGILNLIGKVTPATAGVAGVAVGAAAKFGGQVARAPLGLAQSAYSIGKGVHWTAKRLGGGRVFTSKTANIAGRSIRYPTSMPLRLQGIIGGGILGTAAIFGAADAIRNKGWNVRKGIQEGTLEVQKENFLGATGSLSLASYRQRGYRV